MKASGNANQFLEVQSGDYLSNLLGLVNSVRDNSRMGLWPFFARLKEGTK